ncbi:two-component system chemotaxis sensor kinase CheA [Aneurinibacillus soli]|uniref:Chemotaxis protein CheA n=2 Tax=Aneurinibacillus soli TaxID=1500254 RepID=A0A0U5B1P2_9BACL|nr:two-component system chemotaxis sensor kinase CheA [Aneurinibacillus soli]BAU29921.1 Chemotaxis protein CheA [Aneurinibacillus soli]
MSDMDMAAYMGVFLDEVDEQLQILDEEILNLEQDGENVETIQRIFRAAHTLKGSSAAMGFDNMKELTHKVENVFDLIRNRQLAVNTEIINVIFEAIDYLKVMKEAIINGTLAETNPQPLIDRLEKIRSGAGTGEPANSSPDPQKQTEQSGAPVIHFDVYQREVITKALQDGYQVMAIYIRLVDTCIMKYVRAVLIFNNLKETGEVIASFPSAEDMENEDTFSGEFIYVLATKKKKQEIIQIINHISEIKTVDLTVITSDNLEQFCEGKKIQVVQVPLKQEPAVQPKVEQKVKVNPTVRVDVERLEYLMNLVGELVIDQTRLVDVQQRLNDRFDGIEDMVVLGEVSNHLGRVIGELQEGIMKTRMLPIEQLFNRFPRMVRDLGQKAGKELDFIMEGKETELDRTLIEEIGDPIIHLLRNAIDHGVETPEEREQVGKPHKGRVVLKAAHEENHIVITIEDDGRGIDVEKVAASAIRKGVLTEDVAAKMTDKEKTFLIFGSGVSTAQKVSDISGRGVGMDIVRSNIEKLNGIIDIDTTVGAGTNFSIKLPLTLAIIRSLLVKLSDQTFALPLVNVLEIVRLPLDEVKTIKNREVGVIRGRILPLVRLRERLQIQPPIEENKKRLIVVVVGIADKRVGLIVDQTLGDQEVVIKSLGKYIHVPSYIAGATIMGDGNVALILDVGSIVREEGSKGVAVQADIEQRVKSHERQLVTFELADEEYGLDVQYVKDIITVPEITAVMSPPFSVLGIINLRGQLIPVIDMRQRFGMPQCDVTRKSRVVVVELQERLIGMLVDRVTEVLEIEEDTIEPAPESGNVQSKFIEGISRFDERLVILLHLDLVLNIEELNEIDVLHYTS